MNIIKELELIIYMSKQNKLFKIVKVNIINKKLNQSYTYEIDSVLYHKINLYDYVLIKFNNKLEIGQVLVKKEERKPDYKLNSVLKILKQNNITPNMTQMIQYLSSKMICSEVELANLIIRKNFIIKFNLMLKLNNNLAEREIKEKSYQDLNKKYFQTEESIKYNKIHKEDRGLIEELLQKDLLTVNLIEIAKPKLKVYYQAQEEEYYTKKDYLKKFSLTNYKFQKLLKEKQILSLEINEENYFKKEKYQPNIEKLTQEQKRTLEEINNNIEDKPILFHGITGSGKTTIFKELIKKEINVHKQVLILVPEITLTMQMIEELEKSFGAICAYFNNKITDNEHNLLLNKIKNNTAKIIITTRSGIFIDIPNLSLIIIDEEHDSSYNQNFYPYYHVDDLMEYWEKEKIKVLRASATPDITSYTKSKKEIYKLVTLSTRYANNELPQIKFQKYENENYITKNLIQLITKKITQKENVLILYNVKGYAQSLECLNCGIVLKCPNCKIPLKYYQDKMVSCSYCTYQLTNYTKCQNCQSSNIKYIGMGIEKIQQELTRTFGSKVLRIDTKIAKTKKKLNEIISEFKEAKGKILIGTQIIAKGLNFPHLNQVIVLNTDKMLYFDDFSANEKTYQLLEQISGRPGRTGEKSEVLIYTNHQEHFIYQAIAKHDYLLFYQQEMNNRKLQRTTPYYYIAMIEFRSRNIDKELENIKEIQNLITTYKIIQTPLSTPYVENIMDLQRRKIFLKYKKEKIYELSQKIKRYESPNFQILINLKIKEYGY